MFGQKNLATLRQAAIVLPISDGWRIFLAARHQETHSDLAGLIINLVDGFSVAGNDK
jgi:hypothetical protein